jgi:hypothetical protein
MRFIPITANYRNSCFRIHKIFGLLLEYSNIEIMNIELPYNLNKLFIKVANPYLLKSTSTNEFNKKFSKPSIFSYYITKVFTYLCLHSFILVRILSHFHFPIFNTTEEAILFYRGIYPKEQQNLCLPRSLFAACTSKSFKKGGALFIGVFLPSRAMHAWIIEENKQPDLYDDIWICYQPVAIMCNK